jgi:type II restriction/modification system DNA methylase subunit YeeA
MAYSDREWILEGAAVHVSIIGFDDGTDTNKMLDDQQVSSINPNLTAGIDLTKARRLKENLEIAFQGPVKVGPFEISQHVAEEMLRLLNPHGKSNHELIRPWVNGFDITHRSRGMWIIDFEEGMSEEMAALYEAPFEYLKINAKPKRLENRDSQRRTNWWRLGRSGYDLRIAVSSLKRFIVTPRVSKHRLFVWVPITTLPDSAVIAIARDDDYTFGVLHSPVHEVWALSMGTQLESRPRYTPTTTFETFPFPIANVDQRTKIGQAAKRLNELREGWLNPPESDIGPNELKQRTLTNLYNERPTWLEMAHNTLDEVVLISYGWDKRLSAVQILSRLLDLNLQ